MQLISAPDPRHVGATMHTHRIAATQRHHAPRRMLHENGPAQIGNLRATDPYVLVTVPPISRAQQMDMMMPVSVAI